MSTASIADPQAPRTHRRRGPTGVTEHGAAARSEAGSSPGPRRTQASEKWSEMNGGTLRAGLAGAHGVQL